MNFADRDYFRIMKADPNRETFISQPVPNRGDGTMVVYVARRLSDPDGKFIGLLLGAISVPYFENFWDTSFGSVGSVSLLRNDGVLLARFPGPSGSAP